MQFAELLTKVGYLPPSDVDVLSRAYDAAASAHHDQNRLSGEKFIEHIVQSVLSRRSEELKTLERDTAPLEPDIVTVGATLVTEKV